jgi:protein-S-isoprenylcysteine O-methyltransferase Ste14
MNDPPSLDPGRRLKSLLKSLLHNTAVVLVGFGFALLGVGLDSILGLSAVHSHFCQTAGLLLIAIGFLLRVWATFHFYEHQMRVIRLVPQNTLITTGPYRISRNPLYLGGNVFIFLGAVLYLGSPSGIPLTALNVLAMDMMIRREEKQLEHKFGEDWKRYKSQVRRWL